MKYLIAGLGNVGEEYSSTRHNVGFQILDKLADKKNLVFNPKRYGARSQYRYKGRLLELLKPNTFMNLSGKSIHHWLQKEKISIENLLVIVDDIALPFGTLRVRSKGGNAGHNGLINIETVFGHRHYARLRVGIGNTFSYGQQIDYVLSNWTTEEIRKLPALYDISIKIIECFVTIGVDRTMNQFNKKDYLTCTKKENGEDKNRQMAVGGEDI